MGFGFDQKGPSSTKINFLLKDPAKSLIKATLPILVKQLKSVRPKPSTVAGAKFSEVKKCFRPRCDSYECALNSMAQDASFDVYRSFLRQKFFSVDSLEATKFAKNDDFRHLRGVKNPKSR